MLSTTRVLVISLISISFVASGIYGYVEFLPSSGQCIDLCPITVASYSLNNGFTASNTTSATSKCVFALKNPTKLTTYISAVAIAGGNLDSPINRWGSSPAADSFVNMQSVYQGKPLTFLEIPSGLSTNFAFYPISQSGAVHIEPGETYSFIISFA